MVDYLKRYIHEEGQFKVAIVSTTAIGQELFQKLSPSPAVLQLVNNAASAGLLLASGLKNQGTLNINFDGNGPLGSITAEANSAGQVRSTARHPALVVSGDGHIFTRYIGKGNMAVSRRTSASDQVFRSVVPLVDGGLAYNLAHYLLQSEQVPSAIKLGCALDPDHGVAGAGGVLIQALPGANENLLFILQDRLSTMPEVGKMFTEGDGHTQIANYLFDDMPVKWLETTEVRYQCHCSRQRILQSLSSLPTADIVEMHDDGKELSLDCSFCHTQYAVSVAELAAILQMKTEQQSAD